jgi:hypothetical protein
MKYASVMIDLMAAYPGRNWRMQDLVRYVDPDAPPKRRHAVKKAVLRAMVELAATGNVVVTPPKKHGSPAHYAWQSGV